MVHKGEAWVTQLLLQHKCSKNFLFIFFLFPLVSLSSNLQGFSLVKLFRGVHMCDISYANHSLSLAASYMGIYTSVLWVYMYTSHVLLFPVGFFSVCSFSLRCSNNSTNVLRIASWRVPAWGYLPMVCITMSLQYIIYIISYIIFYYISHGITPLLLVYGICYSIIKVFVVLFLLVVCSVCIYLCQYVPAMGLLLFLLILFVLVFLPPFLAGSLWAFFLVTLLSPGDEREGGEGGIFYVIELKN